MIWIGIAIGIIFTSIFGMALLVIVSKQKGAPIPQELEEYWVESLRLQRVSIEGMVAIADAIEGKK